MTANWKSVKKFRWLFAETLVIVLGVLIALGLDDFQTNRYERELAIEYLQRIQSDLDQDLEYVERVWVQRLRLKRDAMEAIAPVIRGQASLPADAETFLKQVARAGIGGISVTFWYQDTTFQDMLATGNLRLIKDANIRAQISNYYEGMQRDSLRVEARFTDYAAFVHGVLPAELRDELDLAALEAFGTDYAIKQLLTDEFRDLLNQEYNLMVFMEDRDYKPRVRSLTDVLEAYRTQLEKG